MDILLIIIFSICIIALLIISMRPLDKPVKQHRNPVYGRSRKD